MSHSISVQLSRNLSYSIQIGLNTWEDLIAYCRSNYSDRKICIVVDSRVDALYGEKIHAECSKYFKSCQVIQIPEGEQSKCVEQWKRLQDELLENGIERATPLLAIGGGVTGDLAGFAAASVLRGVPLIHMPTSLLAMVDSSIGGKTGINHPTGKNLIGAFYQPDAVFADVQLLQTLEWGEWIGGLAEMLKYAAIRRPGMFDELEDAISGGFQPSKRWMNLIRQSAAIKVDIVQQDEHESGIRAFLNFGHTFGHALEKISGYGNISHGEAVFVGMLAAVHYSRALGASIDKARFLPFKPLYSVPLPAKNCIPELIKEMRHDKKVKDGIIRLVLLKDWGHPCIEACNDEALLQESWEAAFDEINKTN